jgi:hypothetical protein
MLLALLLSTVSQGEVESRSESNQTSADPATSAAADSLEMKREASLPPQFSASDSVPGGLNTTDTSGIDAAASGEFTPPHTADTLSPAQGSFIDPVPSPHLEPAPNFLRPVGEIFIHNTSLWAYNRYYKQYGWASINGSTIASNLGGGWEWDEDQFSINQFGHPYQGSFYFSSARYHGHDFYTSTAYTMLGSLHWEYFMEAEKPSYNDLLTTTLGGAMLGEVSFRLSNAILDHHSSGIERVAREIGATALNPVNGVNRLISGESFKGYSRRTHPPLRRENLMMRLSTGGVVPGFSTAQGDEITSRQRLPRANTEFLVMYGDEFNTTQPYDYFILNMGVNLIKDPVSTVSARAQLASWEIYRSARQKGQLLVGQNFDYIDNGIYKLGVSGLGLGYAHKRTWGHKWFHTLHSQVGAIPLGGVSTEYFRASMRDYNLGGGAFSHTLVVLGQYDRWHTAFLSDRYWLHTRSGAKGDEFIGHFRWEIAHQIWRPVGAALSMGAYDRMARTRDFGTRAEFTQELRLLFTYRFD